MNLMDFQDLKSTKKIHHAKIASRKIIDNVHNSDDSPKLESKPKTSGFSKPQKKSKEGKKLKLKLSMTGLVHSSKNNVKGITQRTHSSIDNHIRV
mmetsp:Transcript_20056/g.23252  ORF Transcript_20056/g.23252 Transcript_20056/m.23252 type:complete len:95 (-) Transcript_20056:203-487(-)